MKIYLSILACLLFSCTNSKEKIPKNILSPTTFKHILKEMHLAQASFELYKTKDLYNAKAELTNAYFDICKKNQVSLENFNQTLNHYSENPKELEEIYTSLLEELTKERSALDHQ